MHQRNQASSLQQQFLQFVSEASAGDDDYKARLIEYKARAQNVLDTQYSFINEWKRRNPELADVDTASVESHMQNALDAFIDDHNKQPLVAVPEGQRQQSAQA